MHLSEPALLLLTGLVLGMRHAFDRDHVAAVTHFISLEPDPLKSAWFGLRWALGHALTVLSLGSAVILLKLKFDPAFERYAELAVGVSLIVLGIWRLGLLIQDRWHAHLHRHETERHLHRHTHDPAKPHVHFLAPTFVGMVHGASGTAEVFVLIPLTLMASRGLAYLYIGLFSAGCAITMSGYGYLAGRFYRRAIERGQRLYRILVTVTSIVGILLGVFWILRNL